MSHRVFVSALLAVGCVAASLWSQPAQPAQPAKPAAQPTVNAPRPKSQAEVDGLIAIQKAPDADARIKAAEEFLIKFADTEFKPGILRLLAASYEQKNDVDKTIIYAERALEADPSDYSSMLMIANGLAGRTREFDLDKEEKLTRAEKYVRQVQDLLKTAVKPNPELPDDQCPLLRREMVPGPVQHVGPPVDDRHVGLVVVFDPGRTRGIPSRHRDEPLSRGAAIAGIARGQPGQRQKFGAAEELARFLHGLVVSVEPLVVLGVVVG